MDQKKILGRCKPFALLNNNQKYAIISLMKKIRSGRYNLVKLKSPCKHKSYSIKTICDRHGIKYQLSICNKCGIIRQGYFLDKYSLIEFYNNEYRKIYTTNASLSMLLKQQMKHGEKIYNFLGKPKDKNILEIGCSVGGILLFLKKKGNHVVGYDIDKNHILYGKKFLSTLFHGSIYDIKKQKYDIIILSHVIEHLIDIDKFINKLRKLIKNNGIIYIETPGLNHIYKTYGSSHYYFQFAHTYYFNLYSLSNFMNKFGFCLIKGDEYIHSMFMNCKNNKHENINIKRKPFISENINTSHISRTFLNKLKVSIIDLVNQHR